MLLNCSTDPGLAAPIVQAADDRCCVAPPGPWRGAGRPCRPAGTLGRACAKFRGETRAARAPVPPGPSRAPRLPAKRAPSAASWALHWPRRTHPGTRERSRTLAPWTSGGPSSMSARWPAWAKRAPRCSPSLPARQRQTDPGWVARQRPTPVTRARMWHSTRPFPSKSSRRRCRLGAGWSKQRRSSWPTRCPRVCGACCCGATASRGLATPPDSSRHVAAARPSSMAANAPLVAFLQHYRQDTFVKAAAGHGPAAVLRPGNGRKECSSCHGSKVAKRTHRGGHGARGECSQDEGPKEVARGRS